MADLAECRTPQTRRHPLRDATERVNNRQSPKAAGREQNNRNQDRHKTPDHMSGPTSPLTPRSVADTARLSVAPECQADSNRSSAVSAASILSGRGKRKTHVGPWQLGRTLGKGATGRVRLAKHAVTGQTAAIKIVSKRSAAMVQSESIAAMDRNARMFPGASPARQIPHGIEREVVIMKLIEHPNVISLYDVWENRGELYLVLEYVEGGELFDYVSSNGPLPEEEAVRLFRQIIAGLAYCHRFNICHRDLKPENILLDSKHNIKLADFGMAALQPAGHWLNTSCGSPHYAAPEIIYGRRYRGDRADTWSCGIILFALLTGFLPFDGGDLANTLRLVKKGEYFLPPWLSAEASDLIQRILQKRPEDRISMQNIWLHPLLKKYEKLHKAMSDHYVGPPPPLTAKDCGAPIASRQDIDMDLLRNLQILWHSTTAEALIEKLLAPEPSHERMFYNALVKFRDEQLENYQGQPLEYSASDYHHISKRTSRLSAKRSQSGRGHGHARKRSQFSVPGAVNTRFTNSINEPKSSGTMESYDPFRSPPHARRAGDASCAHITIHRETGDSTANTADTSSVVEGREATPEQASSPGSPFVLLKNKRSKVNSVRSFQSRVSNSSSRRVMHGNSTSRSASYRRNVSFRHVRNRSYGPAAARARNAPAQHASSTKQTNEFTLQRALAESVTPEVPDSPLLPVQPKVVRNGSAIQKHATDGRQVGDTIFNWKDDTRKISHELSQICEEAFNGGSLSTVCTSSTCAGTETPNTSVSIASAEDSQRLPSGNKAKGRPLPDVPPDSPLSYSVAELTETRRKLVAHSTKDGSDDIPSYLAGVIAHLDRLIEQDKLKARNKRKAEETTCQLPDPFARTLDDPGYLPVITEESTTPAESTTNLNLKVQDTRVPSHSTGRSSFFSCTGKPTIRMVPQDSSMKSLEEIKPLTIRKRHHPPPLTLDSESPLGDLGTRIEIVDCEASNRNGSSGSRQLRFAGSLDPIEEFPKSPRRSEIRTSGENNKKWSWFKHKSHVYEETAIHVTKEVQPIHPSNATVIVHEIKVDEKGSGSSTNSSPTEAEAPPSRKASSEKPKGGFFRNLMKKKSTKNIQEFSQEHEPAPATTTASKFPNAKEIDVELANSRKPSEEGPPSGGRNQNWFARVFQIKPATRVVALNTSKVKARKDVYKILRDWKQYGMEEITMDKANNVIYGKVGEDNFLRLKPVVFSAEFFTVLEHGRQANLSVVRFKQEQGAASSFNKVADTLSNVLKQRGILVEDAARAKKMARVLDPIH